MHATTHNRNDPFPSVRTDGGMVLQVAPDARPVDLGRYADGLELRRRPDPAQHEEMGALDGAAGQEHLYVCLGGGACACNC